MASSRGSSSSEEEDGVVFVMVVIDVAAAAALPLPPEVVASPLRPIGDKEVAEVAEEVAEVVAAAAMFANEFRALFTAATARPALLNVLSADDDE